MPYAEVPGSEEEGHMAVIPKVLHEHINTAYPQFVCLIGTVLPNGFAQITLRGSTAVFDDEHFSLWERGRGSTNASLTDGSKVTIFFRKPPLRDAGLLPRGGVARFYGTAKLYKSGPVYEEIWNRLIEQEKKGDPEKKGFGVLIEVERAEDLSGNPLALG
jgi:hypothetical protein